ncbi:MAG: STAS domain-containing protein [Chthoniobacter sp.]
MGEWHHFARLPRWPRSDAVVFLAAFALTVLIDLTVAVEVGMVLAAVLFIKRMSETTQIMAVDESTETEGSHHSLVGKEVPDGVLVFRVFGAFFFGAADKLETALKSAQQEPKVLILRMRKVLAMDATGLNALEDLYEKMHQRGQHLLLSGPHTQPYATMINAGFIDEIGEENVCPHIEAALQRAREILGLPAAPPTDPLHSEKKELAAARAEVATALERANRLLKPATHSDNGGGKP